MFRKLIILLGLLVAPAFGQELPPPIQDPIATQTYTLTVIPGTQLDSIQQTGTATNLGDDGTVAGVSIGFDFYFYGNVYDSVNISQNGFISFTSLANGCCSGMPLPNFTELTPGSEFYYNYYNTHNTIFAMWSDLISFTGNPYYQSFEDKFTVGWYGVEELGSNSQNCAFDIFGLPLFCNPIGPNKFNFEITLHSNNDIAIRYGNFDNPVNTGRAITSGIQGDQSGEFWQIYYGSDTSTLENKTYVFNSSEVVPIAPIAVDCTLNPTDPTCIINDLIEDEEIYLADEQTGSDDGSDDGTQYIEEEEEELLADEDMMEEDMFEEVLVDEEELELEEMLADLEEEDSVAEEVERIVLYRELTDEEKAQILADSISKNVLESALAISADAAATKETSGGSTEVSSSTSTRTTVATTGSDLSTNESATIPGLMAETKEEVTNAGDMSMELLETGRAIGQEALANTLAASDASASDSVNQAESIAASSAVASYTTGNTDEALIANTTNDISNDNQQSTDKSMMDGTAAAMEAESFAMAAVESAASSSTQTKFDDESNMDAENVTAMVDPALAVANAYNAASNNMNLEFLGIIKPPAEKSDAEVRAEQVVAANKEQQEEINKNYMEADQSGIVAAIAVDADVSSYLSARLADNNTWYKPEDIYKGVVIKDNARGSYFLEKGNTDTYKKMVEEQYK